MNPIRNITRFTYDSASFLGWRLAICRHHVHYIRYFSDREYGGEQGALAAALEERARVYARLAAFPYEPKKALEGFVENRLVSRRARKGKNRRRRDASD